MKSKMKIKMKIAGKLWGLSAILLFVSCAKGFDDNETFSGGVTNAQLESPVIDDNSFSTLTWYRKCKDNVAGSYGSWRIFA